jgi:hypothetical protein
LHQNSMMFTSTSFTKASGPVELRFYPEQFDTIMQHLVADILKLKHLIDVFCLSTILVLFSRFWCHQPSHVSSSIQTVQCNFIMTQNRQNWWP